MSPSPKFANEIARLMRDPDALRSERGQRPDGHGHYDTNQPRVPAGNSKGGQWSAGGYRGGHSDRDAAVTRASLDAAQLAQFGSGNPGDAYAQIQPFDGLLGDIDAGEHLNSQSGFVQTENDPRRNRRMQDFEAGFRQRFRFVSQGPAASERIPGGTQWVVTSTTYAHDRETSAYATTRATPARPMVVIDFHGKLFIRPLGR